MRVRIVLFDLGNVVVDWQPMRLYRQYFDTEAEAQDFCDTVCNMAWHVRHDVGIPMAENAAPLIARYPHFEAQITAWRTRWLEMFVGYVPGVVPLMAQLEERGHPLFGLSNIPDEVTEQTFDAFPMIRILRDVVVSGAEKIVKPDRRIYGIALARMGNPNPGEVLFIDDSLKNIQAAQALGFQTHHFRGAAGLAQSLSDHGLL